MELQGKKILFLGDSITEGHGTSAPEHIYWNVVEQLTGAACKGYGIGGTRIARQQKPSDCEVYDRYFGSRVAEMDPEADIVMVLGGTNDYGHGDAPLGHPADRTPDTFYGALHDLCRQLIEKYPTAVIAFMTPTHRLDEERLVNERGVRNVATLGTYAQVIREVAEEYGLPVCDLRRISGINPAIGAQKALYMPDGLHPNDAGAARIAQRIVGFLQAL